LVIENTVFINVLKSEGPKWPPWETPEDKGFLKDITSNGLTN